MHVAVTAESGLSHQSLSVTDRPGTYLMLKESVLQGLVSGVAPCSLKEQLVLLAQGSGGKHKHKGIVGCGYVGANMLTRCLAARALTG